MNFTMKSIHLILINVIFCFIICVKGEKEKVTTKQYINKCCPEAEYMRQNSEDENVCDKLKKVGHNTKDFSDVPLYYRNKQKTGKYLNDVYSFRYGVMLIDTFQQFSYDYSRYGHNYYLSAEGLLFDEDPNKYYWWIEHSADTFCIDYKLDSNASDLLGVGFWTVFMPIDGPTKNITTLNIVGLFMSSFFLMLTFVVKLLVGSFSLSNLVQMSYVGTAFVAYFLLAMNKLQDIEYSVRDCLGMTYTIYFFLMASFSWMVVMSYDLWRLHQLENIGNSKIKRSIRRKVLKRYKWYSIGAWGVPAVLTTFLIVTNHIDLSHIPSFITPNIPKFGCFLEGGAERLYMYIPLLILILINWVFFFLTSYNLWVQYKSTSSLDEKDATKNISKQDHRTLKNKFFAYLKLSILSGLSWILEMASSFSPNVSFWIVTDSYNMLTSFFVFLILVCNKDTYDKLKKRFTNN